MINLHTRRSYENHTGYRYDASSCPIASQSGRSPTACVGARGTQRNSGFPAPFLFSLKKKFSFTKSREGIGELSLVAGQTPPVLAGVQQCRDEAGTIKMVVPAASSAAAQRHLIPILASASATCAISVLLNLARRTTARGCMPIQTHSLQQVTSVAGGGQFLSRCCTGPWIRFCVESISLVTARSSATDSILLNNKRPISTITPSQLHPRIAIFAK